jgi:pullulanase
MNVDTIEDMTKEEKGVWSCRLIGDYEGFSYVYHIYFDERMNVATDPYAIASSGNHKRTVIVDQAKIRVNSNKKILDPLKSYTDAIIYEIHVRDFSIGEDSGIRHKGEFLGLIEEGTKTINGEVSGLDYLTSIGITHVQLLPVYDFGSVDEFYPLDSYNWGYDPVQYSVPEGSYCTNIDDPYSRIIELKQTIAHLHSKKLRVIMDVVYNHIFDREKSAFENIVPGYYFRTDNEGNISNGSFCGNDIDSTRPMVRRFLLESTRIWIEDYGFDGFRFDLMGILDIETMNAIAAQTLKLDPNAMIYGEGWDMPTFLDESLKASMMNHAKMPSIAHFSDSFREKIKGGTLEDKFQEGGFGSGDLRKSIDAMHLLRGTVMATTYNGDHIEPYFAEPSHSVNYVECHDNHTLWDKLALSQSHETEEIRIKRHKLITCMVLLSQGIPFLHGGQEFLRTKQGEHNSYKSPDKINMFRWTQKDRNKEIVEYVKDVISLRKSYEEFRMQTKVDIQNYTQVDTLDTGIVVYKLEAKNENCGYSEIVVLINPKLEAVDLKLDESYTLILNDSGKVEEKTKKQEVTIEPLAVYVLIK